MKKIMFVIMDGVGHAEEKRGNAVKQANIPFLKSLLKKYPNSLLEASGHAVGLPQDQMGNSEVGHLTMGAGRVIFQPLEKINKEIEDGDIFKNQEILDVMNHVNNNESALHICGLLSDGGVHSHISHILALIDMAKANNIKKLYVHVFTDGRDTLPKKAMKYLDMLSEHLKNNDIGVIGTIMGRYYAMDREKVWDRTKKAYDALVYGVGNSSMSYQDVVEDSYHKGITDEFIEPTIINKVSMIKDNDGIILANFRPDRLTQLFAAITNPEFIDFPTKKLKNIKLVTMMPVDSSIICTNAYQHEKCDHTLLETLSNNNYKILQIAEVCKYPHVTHFFQGDKDIDLPNATKIQLPNKDVATYDLYPAMSAVEVTDKIIEIGKDFDFILVNYANGDMIGHTGNLKACIKGLEVLDICIERLHKFAKENDFTMIITADHGNCEEMLSVNFEVLTSHTTNPVHFIVCDDKYTVSNGSLSNIAPSILRMCSIPIPEEMIKQLIIEDEIEVL